MELQQGEKDERDIVTSTGLFFFFLSSSAYLHISLRILPPSLVTSTWQSYYFTTDKVAGQVTEDDETAVADEMQTQAVKTDPRQRLHRIGTVPPAEP